MMQKVSTVRSVMSENLSYKVVALAVALVLWVTMLGRKESVLTRDLQIQYLLAQSQVITNQTKQKVRVELSGPRMALKKFSSSQEVFTVDLTNVGPGRQVVELNREGLNLPVGVKVLSVYPDQILVVIKEVSGAKEGLESGK